MSNEFVFEPYNNATITGNGNSQRVTLPPQSWVISDAVNVPPKGTLSIACSYRRLSLPNTDDASTTFRIGSIVDDKGGSGGTTCVTYRNPNVNTDVIFTAKRGKTVQILLTTAHGIPRANPNAGIIIENIRLIRDWDGGGASPKNAFKSSIHEITPEGFWTIKGKPFVPIAVHVGRYRKDWSLYAKQGFNVNIWTASLPQAQKSLDNGLYSMFSIGPYLGNEGWGYADGDPSRITTMLSRIDPILNNPETSKNLIGYYLDNEMYDQTPQENEAAIAAIRKLDSERPIYFLHGSVGMAVAYAHMRDITGTYIGKADTAGASSGSGAYPLAALRHLHGQNSPVVFAQVNGRSKQAMISALSMAKTNLATGVCYWSDRKEAPIEQAKWWPTFPTIAKEITRVVTERHGEAPPPPPIEDGYNTPEFTEAVLRVLRNANISLKVQ